MHLQDSTAVQASQLYGLEGAYMNAGNPGLAKEINKARNAKIFTE